MKSLRCYLILILLGLSSSAALADGIRDPGFLLGGGHTTIVLHTLNDANFAGTFTQSSPGVAVVNFDFINDTGFTIGAINLDVTDRQTLSFHIDNTPPNPYFRFFSPTGATTLSPTDPPLRLSWFGTDATHPGIPSATSFSCDTECFSTPPLADFGFTVTVTDMAPGDRFDFTGSLVAIPEPPAILLVLAGGMLLILFKRSQGISVLRLGS